MKDLLSAGIIATGVVVAGLALFSMYEEAYPEQTVVAICHDIALEVIAYNNCIEDYYCEMTQAQYVRKQELMYEGRRICVNERQESKVPEETTRDNEAYGGQRERSIHGQGSLDVPATEQPYDELIQED